MKSFRQFYIEQTKDRKPLVFAYGRFNPPTIGHQQLIDKVVSTANEQGADYFIIPSHSIEPKKKNPLTFSEKATILGYMVRDNSKIGTFGTTFINVLKKLQELGYTNVIQIAGSDRQAEFLGLVNKYNGRPDPSTGNVDFNFETYKVQSSGERDPDSDSVSGMSASKLRQLALNGDFNSFAKGMSQTVPEAVKAKTYNTIRNSLMKYIK